MARGSWDDFTSKWGFGDGACSEDRDFRARDKIVSKLNADPGFQREKVMAVAWDSTGSHNACFVLLFPNPDGLSTEELVVAWEGDRIQDADEMPGLDDYDSLDRLIGEAYDEIDSEADAGLIEACKCALADLEGIMPDHDPSGDRTEPGWQTIRQLRRELKKAGVELDSDTLRVEETDPEGKES